MIISVVIIPSGSATDSEMVCSVRFHKDSGMFAISRHHIAPICRGGSAQRSAVRSGRCHRAIIRPVLIVRTLFDRSRFVNFLGNGVLGCQLHTKRGNKRRRVGSSLSGVRICRR